MSEMSCTARRSSSQRQLGIWDSSANTRERDDHPARNNRSEFRESRQEVVAERLRPYDVVSKRKPIMHSADRGRPCDVFNGLEAVLNISESNCNRGVDGVSFDDQAGNTEWP